MTINIYRISAYDVARKYNTSQLINEKLRDNGFLISGNIWVEKDEEADEYIYRQYNPPGGLKNNEDKRGSPT